MLASVFIFLVASIISILTNRIVYGFSAALFLVFLSFVLGMVFIDPVSRNFYNILALILALFISHIIIKKKSSPQESTDQFNKQPVSDKQIVLSVFFSLLSMIFLSGLVLNFYITTGLVDIGGDVGAQLAALAYALILTYSLFVPFWFVYEEI